MSLLDRFRKKDNNSIDDTGVKYSTPTHSIQWLLNISVQHGFRISQDSDRIGQVLDSLSNKTDGYCPCIPKYARNEDTICPCKKMRDNGDCHCGLFNGTARAVSETSSQPVAIRKNGAKPVNNTMEIVPVASDVTDDQTLVILCDNDHDIDIVRGMVRRHKRSNATSHIDTWRNIDIFVDIGGGGMRGKPWLRIVYESLDGNPNPSPNNNRFRNAYIVRARRTLGTPLATIDMLLEGR